MTAHAQTPLPDIETALREIATLDHERSHSLDESATNIRKADDVIAKLRGMTEIGNDAAINIAIGKEILSDENMSKWLIRYFGKHGAERLKMFLLWRWDVLTVLPH